jgi:site-specific DNA-methyltransferase (adenine-specific)/site-specific DNA-methyltransferase (cytosine-N4-specific)
VFPRELPEWFIKLFTQENDIVLDPFVGSGTTMFAAEALNRGAIGIDIIAEYVDMIKDRFENMGYYYNEVSDSYGNTEYSTY